MKNKVSIKEIVITDNASNDHTKEVCMEFSKKYKRIKYIRNTKKISSIDNWKISLYTAKTKYFMWLGGHDLIDTQYLSRMLNLLENENSGIVATGLIYHFVNDISKRKMTINFMDGEYGYNSIEKRLRAVLNNVNSCYLVNQVWKTKKLQWIMERIERMWINMDHLLALYAALSGKILCDSKTAYYYRINREKESLLEQKKRYERDSMSNIPIINPRKYLLKGAYKIISDISIDDVNKKTLRKEITNKFEEKYDAFINDNIWMFKHYPEKEAEILLDRRKIKTYLSDNSYKYIIFGAGECGKRMCKFLKKYIKIHFIIDNSLKVQGNLIEGIEISNPHEVLNQKSNIKIIIASYNYFSEILNELTNKGFIYLRNVYLFKDFILNNNEEFEISS